MPEFSIRDVLWLTLIVGLVLGWWLDRSRLRNEMWRYQKENIEYMDRFNKRPYYYDPEPQRMAYERDILKKSRRGFFWWKASD